MIVYAFFCLPFCIRGTFVNVCAVVSKMAFYLNRIQMLFSRSFFSSSSSWYSTHVSPTDVCVFYQPKVYQLNAHFLFSEYSTKFDENFEEEKKGTNLRFCCWVGVCCLTSFLLFSIFELEISLIFVNHPM